MSSGTSASSGRRRRRLLPLVVGLSVLAPLTVGWHWSRLGWVDEHLGYPKRPSGYAEIVDTFGQPCSKATHAIQLSWLASDNDVMYHPRVHRKLAGEGTAMVTDQGGKSTNLDNDVFGHIQNAHVQSYLRSGIWGYACRYIRDTTVWSTHAWGIAMDVSASWEPYGSPTSSVNYHHAPIWQDHRWYWGLAFNDPMHFQYADHY